MFYPLARTVVSYVDKILASIENNAISIGYDSKLKSDENCAPGKATSHGFHEDELALFDSAIPHGRVQGQGNRCGRGISVLVQGNHDSVLGNTQFSGRSFQNASIGLMGHKPVNISWNQSGLGNCLGHHTRNVGDRVFENLAAFHAQVANGFSGGRPAINMKLVNVTPIGMDLTLENSTILIGTLPRA
jgi:hypothetical protein